MNPPLDSRPPCGRARGCQRSHQRRPSLLMQPNSFHDDWFQRQCDSTIFDVLIAGK